MTKSRPRVYVYTAVLVVAAVGLACWLATRDSEISWIVLAFALVAAVAERGSVQLTSRLEISISLLPRLFAAVVFGPLAGMIVGAASMAGYLSPPYARCFVYASSRALTSAAAGGLAMVVQEQADNRVQGLLLASIVAVAVGEVLDAIFCVITLAVRGTDGSRAILRDLIPVMPTSILLYTAVLSCLSYAYVELGSYSVLLFLLPAIAAQRLFVMYQAQRLLAVELTQANERLEKANLSFASALVAALDARDRYTAGHSAAVAVYARDIARNLGMSERDQEMAHLAGLVHDIGKIGVPPGILEKAGPLTLGERRQMEKHSETGEAILNKVEAYAEIARIVRHHHERIDGLGYPDGVAGDDIPPISRIICVADAYNAMTSDRPYRAAMSPSVARSRLNQAGGTQFDAEVVAAFDRILRAASHDYATAAWANYHDEASRHPDLLEPAARAA